MDNASNEHSFWHDCRVLMSWGRLGLYCIVEQPRDFPVHKVMRNYIAYVTYHILKYLFEIRAPKPTYNIFLSMNLKYHEWIHYYTISINKLSVAISLNAISIPGLGFHSQSITFVVHSKFYYRQRDCYQ